MKNTVERRNKIQLYSHLFKHHKGRENAVNCKDLSLSLQLDEKDVRRIVSKLRKDGIPICSWRYGYFYPATYSDIVEVATRFNKYHKCQFIKVIGKNMNEGGIAYAKQVQSDSRTVKTDSA